MTAMLVQEFDVWKQGYAASEVRVYIAGTTSLAAIYSDEALTVALSNPQTLASTTDVGGTTYGKFLQSVYVGTPYYLEINRDQETGVQRPSLYSLDGEDASDALVTVSGSSQSNTVSEIVERIVHAENYGEITIGGAAGSAATNTATITAAIGGLSGGGVVILPSGVIRFNQLSISSGIILRGQGIDSTILQSIIADKSITVTGSSHGLEDMTLDGNNLTAGSIGLYGVNPYNTIFNNFKITSFNTGLYLKGAKIPQWENFHISNCAINAKIYGDTDAGDTVDGAAVIGGSWDGGSCSLATTKGLDVQYVDDTVSQLAFSSILFEDNTGIAIYVEGARHIPFNDCTWDGNTTNLDISDDDSVLTPSTQYKNTTSGIRVVGGRMNGGVVKVNGVADDVSFDHVELVGVTCNMIAGVENNLLLKDCYESGVVLDGDTTKVVRQKGGNTYEVTGLTTGATLTRALGVVLEPGQVVFLEAKVIGRQRNGTNKGVYHVSCGAYRPGSALLYINQTDNFTVGDIVTGGTSNATARVQVDSDSGGNGTLTLIDIVGAFISGETLTGSTTGSAEVSGVLTPAAHSLDSGGIAAIRTAYEVDASWTVSFTATAAEVAFNVQGAASQTVDWLVQIKKVVV